MVEQIALHIQALCVLDASSGKELLDHVIIPCLGSEVPAALLEKWLWNLTFLLISSYRAQGFHFLHVLSALVVSRVLIVVQMVGVIDITVVLMCISDWSFAACFLLLPGSLYASFGALSG